MPVSPRDAQRLAARNPPSDRRPVLHQIWDRLLFLHWKMDASELQKHLPWGLTVDTFEGHAFLGIIPFRMRGVHPHGLFPVPGLSSFLELNVRTYVHDDRGVPGVWFFSLDANQPLAVRLARRFFHLNYLHASMSHLEIGSEIRYRCRRRFQTKAAVYHYPAPRSPNVAEPGSLEFFLLERYFLYAHEEPRNLLFRGQVAHEPYRLETRDAPDAWSELPAAWNGFTLKGPPVHVAVAEPVRVRAYSLESV